MREEEFRSAEASLIPFWFLNSQLSKEVLQKQIDAMRANGVTEFMMHARRGLEVPRYVKEARSALDFNKDKHFYDSRLAAKTNYLADEWWEMIGHIVEHAKEKGMKAWIYDEFDWPSGVAGHDVLREHPEYSAKHLLAIESEGELETDSLSFAFTVKTDGDKLADCIEINDRIEDGRRVKFQKKGYKILAFCTLETREYVDLLDADATKEFMKRTHHAYHERFSEYFGKTIPAVFTDETQLRYFYRFLSRPAFPWTKNFERSFQEKYGYDLRRLLPQLVYAGSDSTRVRTDYWSLVAELHIKAYFLPIREWCEKVGIASSGHVLNEELPVIQIPAQASIFDVLRTMHIVGVDHLMMRIGPIAPKIGASIAHRGGKETVCETYGASSWALDLEASKWMADWLFTQGINMINPHGFYASIRGFRKYDYPSSQFYQNAFWPYYKNFAKYVARLRYALTGGTHVAKVAVFYSLNTLWSHYAGNHFDAQGRITDNDIRIVFEELQRLQRDFDFVDERDLEAAEIKDGKLQIGDETFSALVLPSVTTVEQGLLDKIRKFCEDGGVTIFTSIPPYETPDGEKLKKWFSFTASDIKPPLIEYSFLIEGLTYVSGTAYYLGDKLAEMLVPELEMTLEREKHGKGEALFLKSASGLMFNARTRKILDEALAGVERDVKIDGESKEALRYIHKAKDETHVFFFASTSTQSLKAKITVTLKGDAEKWDAESGEIEALETKETAGGISFEYEFPKYGSLLVVVRDKSSKKTAKKEQCNFKLDFKNEWGFKTKSPNILPLRVWDYKRGQPVGVVPNCSGIEKASDNSEKWETVNCDEVSLTSGTRLYRTKFYIRDSPEKLTLVTDDLSEQDKITINDKPVDVSRLEKSKFLDEEMRQIDITDYVKTGENMISVKVAGETGLWTMYLLGNFAIENGEITKERKTMKTGTWTGSYPFYSGCIEFEQEVELPELRSCWIVLEEVRSIAEVEVNGKPAGTRCWSPYRFDVSGCVKKGKNRFVIRVTNTSSNVFHSVIPSGIIGGAWIEGIS